jgi:hypothetical protein
MFACNGSVRFVNQPVDPVVRGLRENVIKSVSAKGVPVVVGRTKKNQGLRKGISEIKGKLQVLVVGVSARASENARCLVEIALLISREN